MFLGGVHYDVIFHMLKDFNLILKICWRTGGSTILAKDEYPLNSRKAEQQPLQIFFFGEIPRYLWRMPKCKVGNVKWSHSVVSDSLRPHGL